MIFYHGTNKKIEMIDLSKCRLRTDFGKGFYLTDKLGTAQGWATRKTLLHGGTPTVLRYEINNEIDNLPGKLFERIPSSEWLEFICSNRLNNTKNAPAKEPRHNHNWVSGPIANDRIADVVDEYLAGEITIDLAIQRARALPQTYQLSLHTLDAIRFVDEANAYYKQFKNNKWTKNWLRR